MVPFFFTRYRKAPLATCVSFCSSACYLFAVLFSVGLLFNWSGIRDDVGVGESLLVAVFFGVAGYGLMKLAEWLAKRKQSKLAAAASQQATAATKPAAATKGRFCPRCGAPADNSDAFCVHCGTKL